MKFKKIIDKPVVLVCFDFGSNNPIIHQIAQELHDKVPVVIIDLHKNEPLAIGLGIKLPTYQLYKEGKLVESITAYVPVSEVVKLCNQ